MIVNQNIKNAILPQKTSTPQGPLNKRSSIVKSKELLLQLQKNKPTSELPKEDESSGSKFRSLKEFVSRFEEDEKRITELQTELQRNNKLLLQLHKEVNEQKQPNQEQETFVNKDELQRLYQEKLELQSKVEQLQEKVTELTFNTSNHEVMTQLEMYEHTLLNQKQSIQEMQRQMFVLNTIMHQSHQALSEQYEQRIQRLVDHVDRLTEQKKKKEEEQSSSWSFSLIGSLWGFVQDTTGAMGSYLSFPSQENEPPLKKIVIEDEEDNSEILGLLSPSKF